MATKYSALEKINLFLSIYFRMFGHLFRFSAWSPFLILASFQVVGLFILTDFGQPVSSTIIYPILNAILPPPALHYPNYYLAIPLVFFLYDNILLGATVWLIVVAAVIITIEAIYEQRRIGIVYAIGTAFSHYKSLLGFWLIQTTLMIAFVYLPLWWLAEILAGHFLRGLAARIALQGLGFIVSALFLYTLNAVLLDGQSLLKSLGISITTCFHNFFFTLFLVAIPGTIRLILDILTTSYAPNIITRGNPDWIILLLLAKIVIGIFLNLFQFGAAVYAYRELRR